MEANMKVWLLSRSLPVQVKTRDRKNVEVWFHKTYQSPKMQSRYLIY